MTQLEKTTKKVQELQSELLASIKEIDVQIAELRKQRQPMAELLRASGYRVKKIKK